MIYSNTKTCIKCRKEIPEDAVYCCYCRAKQNTEHTAKRRGNGQGTVYKLPNGTWRAIRVTGYDEDESGHKVKRTRSKSGFATKAAALAYLPQLTGEREQKEYTFDELYKLWIGQHDASKKTLQTYCSTYKHFGFIEHYKIRSITLDDLQACVDDCKAGLKTKRNMRVLAGLVYKYAIPRGYVDKNLAEYIKIRSSDVPTVTKEGLPYETLQKIKGQIGKTPYAEYVYCHCYLGYRPDELINLQISHYNKELHYFKYGEKTDAGKNRIVTISPKIQPIIDRLTNKPSGYVFCNKITENHLTIKRYREIFYSVLEDCGIENPIIEANGVERHKYTPHSCRHTFATMLKNVSGADKDKMELTGHADPDVFRSYQDREIEKLTEITNRI